MNPMTKSGLTRIDAAVSAVYGTAEEDLNECLDRMGQLKRDTAGDACFVMRHDGQDSNEVKYLQEALDMTEDFQERGARREVAEIIMVERQRCAHRPNKDKVGQLKKDRGVEMTKDT